MTQQTPYGLGDFNITKGAVNYVPSGHYIMNEDPKVEVDIHTSPFTGRNWAVKRAKYKVWELILNDITKAEYETDILPLKGLLAVTFTPHDDETGITYTCDITLVEHEYFKGSYYQNTAIIKLQETTYA